MLIIAAPLGPPALPLHRRQHELGRVAWPKQIDCDRARPLFGRTVGKGPSGPMIPALFTGMSTPPSTSSIRRMAAASATAWLTSTVSCDPHPAACTQTPQGWTTSVPFIHGCKVQW